MATGSQVVHAYKAYLDDKRQEREDQKQHYRDILKAKITQDHLEDERRMQLESQYGIDNLIKSEDIIEFFSNFA